MPVAEKWVRAVIVTSVADVSSHLITSTARHAHYAVLSSRTDPFEALLLLAGRMEQLVAASFFSTHLSALH